MMRALRVARCLSDPSCAVNLVQRGQVNQGSSSTRRFSKAISFLAIPRRHNLTLRSEADDPGSVLSSNLDFKVCKWVHKVCNRRRRGD
jgi:hypothetical protein